jgi:hypothetical protein
MDQRTVVYETSGSIYHQSFAALGVFGLALLFFGAVLLFTDWMYMGATFIVIGVIFTVRAAGLARAGKQFRALAAEVRGETTKS